VNRVKKVTLVTVGLGAACLALTACMGDKANEPFKDAPRSGSNGAPALIIYMPDGFPNLATKCVGGIRYTVAYHANHSYGAISTLSGPGNGC
jgi:hypothetical protein